MDKSILSTKKISDDYNLNSCSVANEQNNFDANIKQTDCYKHV